MFLEISQSFVVKIDLEDSNNMYEKFSAWLCPYDMLSGLQVSKF